MVKKCFKVAKERLTGKVESAQASLARITDFRTLNWSEDMFGEHSATI